MVVEVENVDCVLLDIEGTLCPISFVKETLFPYALKALPNVLASKWHDDEFKPYRDAFPEDVRGSASALQAYVEDLTKRDVKVAYLKRLQGYLWENGYREGAYSTPLFLDVSTQLKKWRNAGLDLAIYSSGSVFAQKLLFRNVKSGESLAGQKRGHPANVGNEEDGAIAPTSKKLAVTAASKKAEGLTNETIITTANPEPAGSVNADASNDATHSGETKNASVKDSIAEDLQWLIKDWFDITSAGAKSETSSYARIAEMIETLPSKVLFLSDNVQEVDAALAAGMQSFLVDRPGNTPLLEKDKSRLTVVRSLEEITLAKTGVNSEIDLPVPLEQISEAGQTATLANSDHK